MKCKNTSCDILPYHRDEFSSPVKRLSFSVLDKIKVKDIFHIGIYGGLMS